VEAENSGRSGIDYKHVPPGIVHDPKDMGVPAYENLRPVLVYQRTCFGVIMPRIAAYVHHKHGHPPCLEKTVMRMVRPDVITVAIAVNPFERLECGYAVRALDGSEIPRMPDFIDRVEKRAEFVIKNTVGVRYETYICHPDLYVYYFNPFKLFKLHGKL